MPPIRMKGDGRKAKNPKKTLARLLSYLKPYRGTMILVVICILVSSLATAMSSYSLDPLINNYTGDVDGDGDVDSTDAMWILRYDAWEIDKFPAET